MGLRSYLSYWVATIIRFLQHVLSVVDTEGPVVTYGKLPTSEDVQNQKQKESIVPKGHHKGKFLKIVTALDGLSGTKTISILINALMSTSRPHLHGKTPF